MNRRKLHEYEHVFEEVGLPILGTQMTGSGHFKFETECNGQHHSFVAPYSASDHRSMMNFRAQLKRWKRNTEGVLP